MAGRSQRKGIAEQTVKILEKGYYDLQWKRISIAEDLAACVENSFCLRPDEQPQLSEPRTPVKTKFSVANETTFAGVRHLLEKGYESVTCLNFASAKNPGGGFLNGSQAQEEALARASGLYSSLIANLEYYETNRRAPNPLYTDYAIYSPRVPVFRDDNDELLEKPYFTDIITAPAVNTGAILGFHPTAEERIEPVMRNRIDRILQLALAQKTEAIVLGAWGCGVFRNDPDNMARWFEESLNKPEIHGRFAEVRFSVLARDKEAATLRAFERFAK